MHRATHHRGREADGSTRDGREADRRRDPAHALTPPVGRGPELLHASQGRPAAPPATTGRQVGVPDEPRRGVDVRGVGGVRARVTDRVPVVGVVSEQVVLRARDVPGSPGRLVEGRREQEPRVDPVPRLGVDEGSAERRQGRGRRQVLVDRPGRGAAPGSQVRVERDRAADVVPRRPRHAGIHGRNDERHQERGREHGQHECGAMAGGHDSRVRLRRRGATSRGRRLGRSERPSNTACRQGTRIAHHAVVDRASRPFVSRVRSRGPARVRTRSPACP